MIERGSSRVALACLAGFGAPNFGDLLYGLVIRWLVESEGFGHPEFFALPSPVAAPLVRIRPIRDLYKDSAPPRAVLVGGGGIIRTDWRTVAEDHLGRTLSPSRPERLRSQARLAWYRRRHLNFDAPGPFIVDPRAFASKVRVGYVSCSVPAPLRDREARLVAEAINRARFCVVRDELSRELLLDAGVQVSLLTVAPDCALAVSSVIDVDFASAQGARLLANFGVTDPASTTAFQIAPWWVGDGMSVQRCISAIVDQDAEVAAIPMGHYSGEEALLRSLVDGVRGAVALPVLSPVETLCVLAACRSFAGTSLHAGIVAGVYGRPLVFLPAAERKATGLLNGLGLRRDDYLARRLEDVPVINKEQSPLPEDAVAHAAETVRRTYREALASLGTGQGTS